MTRTTPELEQLRIAIKEKAKYVSAHQLRVWKKQRSKLLAEIKQRPMPTLNEFALQVRTMRQAQNKYFEKIAIAKKSKLPGDWAAAQNVLKDAKQKEAVVDEAILAIRPIEEDFNF